MDVMRKIEEKVGERERETLGGITISRHAGDNPLWEEIFGLMALEMNPKETGWVRIQLGRFISSLVGKGFQKKGI